MNNLTRLLLGSTSALAVVLGTNIARAGTEPVDNTNIFYGGTGSGTDGGSANTTYTGTFTSSPGQANIVGVVVSPTATDAMDFSTTAGSPASYTINFNTSASTLTSHEGTALHLSGDPSGKITLNDNKGSTFTSAARSAIYIDAGTSAIGLSGSQVSGFSSVSSAGVFVAAGQTTIFINNGASVSGGIDITNTVHNSLGTGNIIDLGSSASLDKIVGGNSFDSLSLLGEGGTGHLNLTNVQNIAIRQNGSTWDYTGSAVGNAIQLNGGAAVLQSADTFGSTAVTLNSSVPVEYTVSGTFNNSFAIGANTLTLISDGGVTAAQAGQISDGGSTGSVVFSGPGTFDLTGNAGNNGWTGGTTINGGATVEFNNAGQLSGNSINLGDSNGGGTLALTANAVTLSQPITLSTGGTDTVSAASGASLTLTGLISGAGAVTLNGGGTITLQNSNSYSGGTTITGGTTAIDTVGFDNSSSFGSGMLTLDNGTLRAGTDPLNINNSVVIGSGGGTIDADGSTVNFGQLSGAGTLKLEDSNPQTVGGVRINSFIFSDYYGSSFTGPVEIGANTLVAYYGGSGQSAFAGSDFTLDSNAVLGVDAYTLTIKSLSGTGTVNAGNGTRTPVLDIATASGQSHTYSGTITDDPNGGGYLALEISGTGTQILTGANTYSAGTTVTGGATLGFANNSALGSGSLTLSEGTLQFSNGAGTLSNPVVVGFNAGNVGTLDANGQAVSLNGVISGPGGLTLTDNTGTGTFTINGVTETYTGPTLVTHTGLFLANGASIASSSGLTLQNSAILDLSQNGSNTSITSLAGDNTAIIHMGGGTLTITDGNSSGTFSGVLADGGTKGGTGASLTISGGTATFGGVNTYTGGTTVSGGGALALTDSGSIATSSGVVLKNTGSFDISGTTSGATITSLSGEAGSSVGLGSKALVIHNASGTFAGQIGDGGISGGTGGSVEIAGGTQTLSGVNTYTGATQVDNGVALVLTGAGSIAASSGVILKGTGSFGISNTGSGYATTGDASITSLSGESGSTVDIERKTLTLTNASGTFAGSILDLTESGGHGRGGLTISGGSETLSGVSGYAGSTLIASGATLKLTGAGSIANSEVIADGTFDISGDSSNSFDATIGSYPGAAVTRLVGEAGTSGHVVLGARALAISAGQSGDIFPGVISGTGELLIGGGTETLTGVNTYTGGTDVYHGANLALSGSGSIASSARVLAEGTFDISATTSGASLVSLSGNGSVVLGSRTLTLTNAQGTIGGVVSGTGGLVITGNETLTGANTYSGGTTLESGTLGIGSDSALGSGGLTLTGGALQAEVNNVSYFGNITVNGNAAIDTNSYNMTIGSDIESASGAIQLTFEDSTNSTGKIVLNGSGGFNGTFVNTLTSSEGLVLAGAGFGGASLSNGTGANVKVLGTTNALAGLAGAGTVNITGGALLTLASANSTFNGVIQGAGNLTVAGGTEALTGANTYTGATIISGGATLALSGAGSIADSSSLTDNGTFDISGTTSGAPITALTGAGHVALGSGLLTITNASGTFGGVIADGGINGGTGGSVEIAAGTQTLSGASTYTGATTIDSGVTLALSGAGSIAASSVTDNGTLDISATTSGGAVGSLSGGGNVALGARTLTITNASGTFSGVIADGGIAGGTGGSLVISGGTETLSHANTYTGATQVDTGATLTLNSSGSIADTSGVALKGTGALILNGGTQSITTLSGEGGSTVSLNNGGTLNLTNASGTFKGVISGNTLYVQGGTETLSGVNTLAGEARIGSGATLALSGSGSLSDASVLLFDGNGTFDISGASAGASVTTIATYSGGNTINLGAHTLTITQGSGNFVGTITGTTGGITLENNSWFVNAPLSYSGTTEVDGNADLIIGANAAGSNTSALLKLKGASTFETSAALSFGNLTGEAGTTVRIDGPATLTLSNASGTFAGKLAGGGSTLAIAAGTETLSGDSSSFSGSVAIASGATAKLTGAGSLGSGNVAANGTFDMSGTTSGVSIGALTGTGHVALGGQALTVTVPCCTAGGVFSGVIADGGISGGTGGSLTFAGGTETLSGVNTYTGATKVNSNATLALSGSGSIAASNGVTDNGTFDISGTIGGASIASLSGSGQVALGSQTLTITNASGTFSGLISDGGIAGGTGGGLTIAGGTETLSGLAFYSGATQVDAGATLALSGAGSIANSSGLTLKGTGAFDISGTTGASITMLAGESGSSVKLGGQTLTITNASGTFAGTISDGGLGGGTGGSLDIQGGTQTLAGANSYTGTTTIESGTTLALAGSGSIASSRVALAGTLDVSNATSGASIASLSGAGAVTLGAKNLTLTNAADSFSGVISGSGELIIEAGTEKLFGANTYTGMTVIDAGASLVLAEGGNAGSIAGSIINLNNGTVDISAGTSGTPVTVGSLAGAGNITLGSNRLVVANGSGSYANDITGTGSVEISGGTQTFTAAQSYTGVTLIDSGATLALSGSGAIANSSEVDVGGGTFDISGASGGVSITSLSGENGASQIKLGANTLTINSNSGFEGTIIGTGGLTITGGTLGLRNTEIYSGATTIENGAAVTVYVGGGMPNSSVDVETGGTLDVSGDSTSTVTIAGLSGAGSVTLGGNSLVLDNAANTSFSGIIGGTGGIEISGGSQTFAGAQTYTGTTTIDAGATLALSGSGAIASSSGVTDNGTFDISGTTSGASIVGLSGGGTVALGNQTLTLTNASGSFGGAISGTGGLTIDKGTLALSGANTYSGFTVIGSGVTLNLVSAGSLANSHVADNGTLDISGATSGGAIGGLSGGGGVNLGSQTLTIANANDSFGGTISGTGGVTITGGTQVFSSPQSYTGATTIAGGYLIVGAGVLSNTSGVVLNTGALEVGSGNQTIATVSGNGNGQFYADSGATITINAFSQTGGALNVGESATVTIHELSGSSTISMAESGTVVAGDASNTTFSGSISGGSFQKVGTGTLTLSGNLGSNEATINITAGTIKTGSATALGTDTFLTIASGATLDEDGFSNSLYQLNNTSTGTITNTGAAGAVLTFLNSTGLNATVTGAAGIGIAAGKTLVVDSASSFTGPLLIPATSTVNLGATGTVTGAAVADNGTFDITGGAATSQTIGSLTGSGTVNIGAKTLIISAGNGTFNGMINGTTGGVSITGGDEVLAGTNSYSGTTTVGEGGTLTLNSTTTLGTSTLDFKAGSTLKFGTGGTFTNNAVFEAHAPVFDVGSNTIIYSGQLSGAGDLAVTGNGGTLILTNTSNSYAGGTEVYGGSVLQVDADAELGGVAQLQLGDATTAGTLQLASSFNPASGRNITLNAGGGTIDTQTFNSTIASVISGTGSLTKAGTGTLTLSGANTYTGATSVNAGTLAITGSIASTSVAVANNAALSVTGTASSSAITVASGGSLVGTGMVGATTITSGGKLSPGVGGVGTLAVNGALSLASGSTTAMDVTTSAADKITVSGAATLGGTLAFNAASGTYAAGTDDKLISASSLNGTFASISGLTGLNITPTVQYSATGVDLIFPSSTSGGSTGQTPPVTFLFQSYGSSANQVAAGTALTASSPTNALYTQLGGAVSANTPDVAGALTQLSGEVHASMRSAMIQSSHIIRDIVLGRADSDPSDGVSLWARGFGGYGALGGNGNASAVHQNDNGAIVGADVGLMPGLRAGIAGAWLAQKVNLPAVVSSATGSTTHIIGYANWTSGPIAVDLGGDYGWGASQVRRQVTALSENDTDHQSADMGQVFGNVGYRLTGDGGWTAEPYAGLAYVSATTGAFTETGGNGALAGGSATNSQTYASLGVRGLLGEYSLDGSTSVTPNLDIAWQHGFNTLTPGQSLSFITAAQSFTVLGVPLEQDAAAVQAGLDFKLMPGLTASFGYDGNLGARDQTHFVRGGLEWQF